MDDYGMFDEHKMNMQMKKIREKAVEEIEEGVERSIRIFGKEEIVEGMAKMHKAQYDAFRLEGFTEDQAMALLLKVREAMK